MLLKDCTITAIDFESTGVCEGYPNEPWQIGMVELQNGKVRISSCYDKLLGVDADRPFNPYAPGEYHKIREEIEASPQLASLWPELQAWWLGRPMLAHNASVARGFVNQGALIHQVGPWIDTLTIYRYAYPTLPSHKLEDLVPQFGLLERLQSFCPGKEAHDALYDAVASALLLEILLEKENWAKVTLDQILKLSPQAYYKYKKQESKDD